MKKDVQDAEVVKSNNMQEIKVRKLQQEEHHLTRKLWEEVFTEDSSEFLDYYYSVKIKDNEIYVIEDEGEIVSMIHLNPYQMRMGEQIYLTHYIVAVATDPHYRKRGFMSTLLRHTMTLMADRGEPFTFLMPASEAIYKPFGFTFCYEQKQGNVCGKRNSDGKVEFQLATLENSQEMADFANAMLQSYDIATWRTKAYYDMILKEQESQNGGILLAKEAGELVGVFCFAKEKEIEIREPLFLEEHLLKQAIYYLTGNETEQVQCLGYGEDTKPMIMAKALQPEMDRRIKNAKVFINEIV